MSVTAAYAPEGFHTVTPYVIVKNASAAIDFYARAFGATELSVRKNADGKVLHAEIRIGDSPIMLAEEFEYGGVVAKSPQVLGATSMHFYLYVRDVDAWFERAVGAGAGEVMPVTDQPYGDRSGGVTDPFGHVWWIATLKPRSRSSDVGERTTTWRDSRHGAAFTISSSVVTVRQLRAVAATPRSRSARFASFDVPNP